MEITWYGLGCFRFMERGFPAVITDPFDEEETGYALPRTRAEVVTVSTPLADARNTQWKAFKSNGHTFASPGEYEVGGVFISGIESYRDHKHGAERGENIIYTYNLADIAICHLGDLGHVPNQTCIEAIGPVHILLIPVGVPGGLTPSMASEIVSLIEPNLIIPMDYKTPGLKVKRDPVDRFLKEMGITQATSQAGLKLTARDISEETQVLLLEPQKG